MHVEVHSMSQDQQESVDQIEENVSTSEQNVESGVKNLVKVNMSMRLHLSNTVISLKSVQSRFS